MNSNKESNGFKRVMPKKKGWAKDFVDLQIPIPSNYRSNFYDELVSEDQEYRAALEESLRKFGVRWS